MIHAQQKGYSPAEILRGLCDAVARNFKSSIVKGRPVEAPGRADRRGVAECRRDATPCARRSGCPTSDLFVPAEYAWCGAIGTAILEAEEPRKRSILEIHRLRQHDAENGCRTRTRSPPSTSCSCATACRSTCRRPATSRSRRTWASISARSRPTSWSSTTMGAVIHDIYLRTAGPADRSRAAGARGGRAALGQPARDPRRRHDRLRPRTDRRVRGRRRRSTTRSPRTKPAPSTSAARSAASRSTPSSRSAGRTRSSSRSRTAWWSISP